MGFFSKCFTFFDNEVENEYQLWRDCRVKQYQEEIVESKISNQEKSKKTRISNKNIKQKYTNYCLEDEHKKFDHKAFLEDYHTCVFYKKLYYISTLAILSIAVLYSIVKLINVFV